MRKKFLTLFVFTLAFSDIAYGDNFLENDLLTQLYTLQDSSILDVKEGKFYVSAERVIIAHDMLVLNSDFFGPLVLSYVAQDTEGMYVGLYDYYTCDNCGTAYQSPPSECGSCGGTSFTRHDQLDD